MLVAIVLESCIQYLTLRSRAKPHGQPDRADEQNQQDTLGEKLCDLA